MVNLRNLVLTACLVASPAAWADDLPDDLMARRASLLRELAPETMLVLHSAPTRVYSGDVDYEYRQDSNLYYLTGIEQPETVLVLMPSNATRKAILFVQPRDFVREHWEGRRLTLEEASAQSGIETVYSSQRFEDFLNAMLTGGTFDLPRDDPPPEFAAFQDAVRGGLARLALVFDPRPELARMLSPTQEFANRARDRFAGVSVVDVTEKVHALRQVKTAYERRVLEQSVKISSEAHLAGMRAARPGAYEYEVEAAIEYVFRSRGAEGWGYPSIVASGPNATVLHYTRSTRQMRSGDLLLVDAAGTYEYLTGDITRTYPVSGRFTPEQEDIYRIVLQAQTEAMQVVAPGVPVRAIHRKTVEVVKQGLHDLGLITDTSGDQYRTWYTHGAVHFIGLDVHDVGDYQRPLEAGMAFTIEPGIYVSEGALDHMPQTPENAAFIEQVRPAYEKYKNIGVRIEDSVLLTEDGLLSLSTTVPKTIEEIEAYLERRGPASNGNAPPNAISR